MRSLIKYYLLLLVLFNSKVLLSQTPQTFLFEKIDSIKTVLKTKKEDTSKIRSLWWLSRAYSDFYNYRDSPTDYYKDSAIKFAKLALELSNMASGSARQKCICLGRLADIHAEFNPAEGLKYMFASLKECQAGGHQVNVSNAYCNISNILSRSMGDHAEALKYNLAALEIRKKIKQKHFIAASYHNIRQNYYDMGNYEQALNYALLGFKNDEENLSREQLAGYHIAFGKCYAQLGKFDEALKYLQDALTTFQELKNDGRLAQVNVYLGISYAKRASQITYPESKKMYTKAIEYLNKGLSIRPLEDLRRDAYPVLSEIYKEMGDFENALEYKNRLTALNDSILNYETQNRIANVRIEYETEKAIAVEKAMQEKLKLERERTNILLLTGISAISIVLGLLFLLFRQRVSKRRTIEKAEFHHRMAELELQSLRAQLNPHFMFNSLNAIQELILKEDNDSSHLYLSRFAELLRMLLDTANQPLVSLRRELNFLELYLSLENLRIPDLKFSVEVDPSIDTNRVIIPNMILQPYIENAIWHGLSPKKGEKSLKIKINKKGDNMICDVEDNGIGRKEATELKSLYRKEHRSKGMELLSKRFSLLSKEYGSDIQTIVEDLHDNGTALGTKVSITVPYSLTEQVKPVYS